MLDKNACLHSEKVAAIPLAQCSHAAVKERTANAAKLGYVGTIGIIVFPSLRSPQLSVKMDQYGIEKRSDVFLEPIEPHYGKEMWRSKGRNEYKAKFLSTHSPRLAPKG